MTEATYVEFEGTSIKVSSVCGSCDGDSYTYNDGEIYLVTEHLTEQFYGSYVPQNNADDIAQCMAHWINIGWMDVDDTIYWPDKNLYFSVNREGLKKI